MGANVRQALALAAALTAASTAEAGDGAPQPVDMLGLPRGDTLVLEGSEPAQAGDGRLTFAVHAGISDAPAFFSQDTTHIALVPEGADTNARRSCPVLPLERRNYSVALDCGLFSITAKVNAAASPAEIALVQESGCVVTTKPALDFSQCGSSGQKTNSFPNNNQSP